MSKIQELLSDKDDQIDYENLINEYPWIISENQDCILSPDSDGLLCGLIMSDLLDWNIKGFYDGKILIIEEGLSAQDCVFLDIEVFRENIKSFGHHMLLYSNNNMPMNWYKFNNCINPNNLRNYDKLHTFRLKYPLGSIHLLLGILGHEYDFKVPKEAISPLFFVDGTFNVLFKYPENVLNWLDFLGAKEDDNPLNKIFLNDIYSVYELMLEMDEFFRERDEISITKERGDRLKISETDGSPYNIIDNDNEGYKLKNDAVDRVTEFINLLTKYTNWNYNCDNWLWKNYDLFEFSKSDFVGENKNLNGDNFTEMIQKEPLSWAITSGRNLEYTLEEPDTLP